MMIDGRKGKKVEGFTLSSAEKYSPFPRDYLRHILNWIFFFLLPSSDCGASCPILWCGRELNNSVQGWDCWVITPHTSLFFLLSSSNSFNKMILIWYFWSWQIVSSHFSLNVSAFNFFCHPIQNLTTKKHFKEKVAPLRLAEAYFWP